MNSCASITVDHKKKTARRPFPTVGYRPRKSVSVNVLVEPELTKKGGIRYRHYYLSAHALDRFIERCKRPLMEAVGMLANASLACTTRSRSFVAQRVINGAEETGGYALFNKGVYFIVKVDECTGVHVVLTVITPGIRFKR